MDKFEQLKNRRPGHLTPDEVAWLISRVGSLSHQIEEYENPMPCGHFGVNNQPDDSNNYFCMVCREVKPLQVQLAANDEVICGMRKVLLEIVKNRRQDGGECSEKAGCRCSEHLALSAISSIPPEIVTTALAGKE